jgi:hypothetical protein
MFEILEEVDRRKKNRKVLPEHCNRNKHKRGSRNPSDFYRSGCLFALNAQNDRILIPYQYTADLPCKERI